VCARVSFRTTSMGHRDIESPMSVASLVVLVVYFFSPVVKTFNLDITAPDIRTGPPDSLFGFAVAASSTRKERYDYGSTAMYSHRFDATGSMLAHLERYWLDHDRQEPPEIVARREQPMIAYLGIYLYVPMEHIRVIAFSRKVS
jgi:hypothetical protein